MDIINYFEPTGITAGIVRDHLQSLLERRLIQPYDPTDMTISDDLRVRITHAGQIHYEFAFDWQEGSYVQEMAFTTPMRQTQTVRGIRTILNSGNKLQWSDWKQMREDFMRYCLDEDHIFISLPNTPAYDGQRIIRQQLRAGWVNPIN